MLPQIHHKIYRRIIDNFVLSKYTTLYIHIHKNKHNYFEVGNGSRHTLIRVPEMLDTPPSRNNYAFLLKTDKTLFRILSVLLYISSFNSANASLLSCHAAGVPPMIEHPACNVIGLPSICVIFPPASSRITDAAA